MIAIVDYGLGNIRALSNVYFRLNRPVLLARQPEDLDRAAKIILPGVGAFDHAMESLARSGLLEALEARVRRAGVPLLGICVGMQMLARSSDEGRRPGLGWIAGAVRRLRPADPSARVPHMGWNRMSPRAQGGLLEGIGPEARFYFLHSYYFECDRTEDVLGTTDYHGKFASVVGSGPVYGVQFHPEKSHGWGARILENFARL